MQNFSSKLNKYRLHIKDTKVFGFRWMLLPITLCFLVLLFGLAPGEAKAATLSQPPNNLGLVGYWSFEDGSGSVATDFSGNGNDGTLTNMDSSTDWVSGRVGKALDFDGSNDYVSISNFDPPHQGSVSFWFKTRDTLSPQRVFGGADAYEIRFRDENEAIANDLFAGGSEYLPSVTTLSADTWYHVVNTYNFSTNEMEIYINGELDATSTDANDDPGGPFELRIGHRTGASGDHVDGQIDEVKVYNRELLVSEVGHIYASGLARINRSQTDRYTDGLVGMWSFDGNDISGTTTLDRSGNGNDGTLTGGPLAAAGKSGQALDFDGADDYVLIGNSASLTFSAQDSFSFSVWAKVYNNQASDSKLIEKKVNDGPHIMIDGNSNNSVSFDIRDDLSGNSAQVVGTSPIFDDDVWHHILGVKDGNTLSLYIDGESEGSDSASFADITNNGDVRIGWSVDGSTRFTEGLLDEVRIYNKALSTEEIQGLYSLGDNRLNSSQNNRVTDSLVGLWSFNGPDISGTTASDGSGQGNDGTLTGGPTPDIGVVGQALNFDGTDDYVDAGSGTDLDDIFSGGGSYSLWMKPVQHDDIFKTTSGKFPGGWLLHINGFSHLFQFPRAFSTNNGVWRTPSNSINYGEWMHVVVVYDDSSTANDPTIYINGVSQTITEFQTPSGTASTDGAVDFHIGNNPNGNSNHFEGVIDEVRVYGKELSASEVTRLYQQGRNTGGGAPQPSTWYASSWNNRKKITVDSSQVDASLSDFPVYVDMSDLGSDFFTNVNSDGGDIRVTTANGITEIPREIVGIDTGLETGELHFRAPSLSSSADTEFYIYYGNTGASDYATGATYGAENVWNDYLLVSHDGDIDSSGNLTITDVGGITPGDSTGKMGSATTFDDVDDYFQLPDEAGQYPTGDFALQAWVNTPDDIPQTIFDINSAYSSTNERNSGIHLDTGFPSDTNNLTLTFVTTGDQSEDAEQVIGSVLATSTWQSVYSVRDGSSSTLYLDGSQDNSGTTLADSIIYNSNLYDDDGVRIGAWSRGDLTDIFYFWNGLMDELRIRPSSLSSDWISAEHTNQNTPTTFYTVGSQEIE